MNRFREKIRKLNSLEGIKYSVFTGFPSRKFKAFRDNIYIHLSNLYSFLFLKKRFFIDEREDWINEIVFFKQNGFLVVKDFLDKHTVDFFLNSLQNLDEGDFVNSSDIASPNCIFRDRVIKNLDFLYDERLEDVLIQYNHVRDTHKMINNAPVDLFNMLIDKSERLLNSRVSIEVSEIYETLANGDKIKVNSKWHLDGDIHKSFKVLIYLSDVRQKEGALKIKSKINNEEIEFIGEAGTAIFFKNSELLHLGSLPENKSRWCLNFKVYPKIISSSIVTGNKAFNFVRRRNLFRGA